MDNMGQQPFLISIVGRAILPGNPARGPAFLAGPPAFPCAASCLSRLTDGV